MKVRGIYGCKARMYTWECVSPFEGELPPEKREALFRAEFPDAEGKVYFQEMVAFNDAEGRRHRYLIIFPEEFPPEGCSRMLPVAASLYGWADKFMREREDYGNFRAAFWCGSTLYILVFWEGRLCHWAEEVLDADVLCRLDLFDEFLKQDGLFSRTKEFKKELVRINSFDGVKEWETYFWRAAKDPFWKNLRLSGEGILSDYRKSLFYGALITVLGLAALLNFVVWRENELKMEDVVPPELSPVPAAMANVGALGAPEIEPFIPTHFNKQVSQSDCDGFHFKVRGIVAGKIFQACGEGGENRWFRLGDSLENYRVVEIGRDRVILGCGGDRYEIRAERI